MLLQCSCLSSQGTLCGSRLVSTDPESQYIGFHRAEEGFCPEFCLIFRQFLTLFDVKTNPWGGVCVCVCTCACPKQYPSITAEFLPSFTVSAVDPPGSSVHGILQPRILEWVAIPFCRNLLDPGIKHWSPVLQADSLLAEPPRKLLSNNL